MFTRVRIVFLILLSLSLIGCAESVTFAEAQAMEPVGFWPGYFDGVTLLLSLFGSLLDDQIAIYAIYNNGGYYDFGFVLGVGTLGSWSFWDSKDD